MFNEKQSEWTRNGELPVWQSPKYIAARDKAIEIINSKKYGLNEADFWILMNLTSKKDKMAYSGLIISHNGCLKINDNLDTKFDPSCVSMDKEGYRNSLVYSYCSSEQGIYEVGEVNAENCKNDYPYAMAFKRLFDRVVLKLSKLAYAGIYSDSESDEFVQQITAGEDETATKSKRKTKNEETDADKLRKLIEALRSRNGWSNEYIEELSRKNCNKSYAELEESELSKMLVFLRSKSNV